MTQIECFKVVHLYPRWKVMMMKKVKVNNPSRGGFEKCMKIYI